MSQRPLGESARWFEDFRTGQRIVTQGRTITPTDTSVWCMFTGDMHPFHVDQDVAASGGLFGDRFPPGQMSVAIASGLWERLGLLQGTGLFIVEQTIRYRRPVLHGDTIHMELEVLECRTEEGKGRGIVSTAYSIVRLDGEACVEGELSFAVAARPTDEEPRAYGLFEG